MANIEPNAEGLTRLQVEKLAVEGAMREAVHEAVLKHKRLGPPMVEWHDGQIVWIPADELTLDDSSPAS